MASLLSPVVFPIKFSSFYSATSLRFSVSASAELKKTPDTKRTPKPTNTLSLADETSTPPVSVPPKKVLVPIGFGTEEMEAVIIVDVLRRAGAEVTVASVEPQLEVKASLGTKLVADTCISTCSDQIFDLVALPGGMPGSVSLRDCETLRKITSNQAESGRLYGAISAAPAVTLLPWDLLEPEEITCHPAFFHKLPTFLAVKSNTQVSGGLTTSRGPGTCFEFALCLVDQLFGESIAKELGASLLLDTAASDLTKEEFNEEEWSIGIHPRVLIPVANGSEGIEVVTIADILKRARVDVTIASLEKSLQIVTSQGFKIVAHKLMKDAAESVYDLILLPGATAGAERLQKSSILKKMLREQESAGRIYGAVCSSPLVLHKHGLLKDKRATAHPSVVSSITDKEVNGTKVVIDGKLITSRGLATVIDFAMAIVSKLFGHNRAMGVATGLVIDFPSK